MDCIELFRRGKQSEGRTERYAEHCKEGKRKPEEYGDAADARLWQIVHAPVVSVIVDDPQAQREPNDCRSCQKAHAAGDNEGRRVEYAGTKVVRAHPRAPSSVAYCTTATPASASSWLATGSGYASS